jgi:hypothetical protein
MVTLRYLDVCTLRNQFAQGRRIRQLLQPSHPLGTRTRLVHMGNDTSWSQHGQRHIVVSAWTTTHRGLSKPYRVCHGANTPQRSRHHTWVCDMSSTRSRWQGAHGERSRTNVRRRYSTSSPGIVATAPISDSGVCDTSRWRSFGSPIVVDVRRVVVEHWACTSRCRKHSLELFMRAAPGLR